MVKALFFLFFGCYNITSTIAPRVHPLFVSITDAEYNATNKTVEIISKIFADDLEGAIQKKYNVKIDLFAKASEVNKQYLLKYLQEHLKYTIDNKVYPFSIIGYELNKGACWIYLEMTNIASIKNVTVFNNLLYEYSDKQINLVHFNANGNNKSNKLNHPATTANFTF